MKRRKSGRLGEKGVEVRQEDMSWARVLPRAEREVAWIVAVTIGEGISGGVFTQRIVGQI